MKILLTALLSFVAVCSCPVLAEVKKEAEIKAPTSSVKYAGGDGSSMEKAVVIKGARDSEAGIASEYAWVAKKYPGYQMKRQSLLNHGGKSYDMLSITTKDGKELDVYFDITEFFGK